MEDALISPEGFMILSGAGLIDASKTKPIYQHVTETVDAALISVSGEDEEIEYQIKLSQKPYLPTDKNDNYAYVMFMKNGDIVSEPYIPIHEDVVPDDEGYYVMRVAKHAAYSGLGAAENAGHEYTLDSTNWENKFDSVLVDYYVEHVGSEAQQIEITADKFGGNYYLEASTLFRDTNGVDMPAEFIIPNCKIQSNFTFTMASSGDPSELMRLAA